MLLGTKQFYTTLDIISKVDMPNLYRSSLKDVTTTVLRDALIRTPVDTGVLRASARDRVFRISQDGGKATVSYHAPYAIPVHEILTSVHPVGESKFLERALLFLMPMFPAIFAKRITAFLSRRYYRNVRSERLR